MSEEMRHKVRDLKKQGLTESVIAKRLNISVGSVNSYKSHITSKKEWTDKEKINGVDAFLESYINGSTQYMVFPASDVLALDPDSKSQLVEIIKKLEGETTKKDLKEPAKKDSEPIYKDLPESEIREKVIELRKKGIPKEDTYAYFDEEVKGRVSSYNAHFTMLTYHKRGMVD